MRVQFKKIFRQDKLTRFSFYVILSLALVAIFADFLANEKPIIAKVNGEISFPIFQCGEWKKLNYEFAISPLIPYLPNNIDLENAHGVSPFQKQKVASWRWRHWLGTDELGRDILAGLIYGTRIAFLVGIFSVLFASIIGVSLGSLAGYFGDDALKISVARLLGNFIFVSLGLFYGIAVRKYDLINSLSDSIYSFTKEIAISILILAMIVFIGNLFISLLKKNTFLKRKITIPLDIIISRFMEIFLSIPILFLILSIASLAKPSLMLTIFLISITMWTGIARLVRAELLKIRELEYMESAKTLGLSHFQILIKHALPNALTPIIIAMAFGVASAILVESSLSFIGIGVSPDTVTWGSILSVARKTPQSWWIAVFPGGMIFLTMMCFNILGEHYIGIVEIK